MGVGALARHDEPRVGLGDAQLDRLVGLLALGLRLVALVGIEVEGVGIVLDRLPGKELAHSPIEFFEAGLVGSQEDEGVAVDAGACASLGQVSSRPPCGRGCRRCVATWDVGGVEYDQAGVALVGHVAA